MPARRSDTATLTGTALAAGVLIVVGPDPAALRAAVRNPAGWTASHGAEEALAATSAGVAWLVVAWLSLGVALVLGSRAPGALGRVATAGSRVVAPAVLRRTLPGLLGTALVAGPAAPAAAGQVGPPTPTPTASAQPDPRWPAAGPYERAATTPSAVPPVPAAPTVPAARSSSAGPPPASAAPTGRLVAGPSRPAGVDATAAAAPRPTHQRRPAAPRTGDVVVVPGDTLWAIARRALDPGATDAQVDRAWRRWYAANSAVIGPDPHLIRPGQRLRPPAR